MIVFPDNTVLINFATIGRMDLLEQLVGARGRWCLTVSQECDESAGYPGLSEMRQAHRIFGEPLMPETGREHEATRRYRDRLRTPGQEASARKNLGEAETLAIIECRSYTSAVLVTDDTAVQRLDLGAGGPQVTGTWGLLKLAHRAARVSAEELWVYAKTLAEHGRHRPPTDIYDRLLFDDWLAA